MTNNNELYSIFYNIISELAEDLSIYKDISKVLYNYNETANTIDLYCLLNQENIAISHLGRILERIRITQKFFDIYGINFKTHITSLQEFNIKIETDEPFKEKNKNAEIFQINNKTKSPFKKYTLNKK